METYGDCVSVVNMLLRVLTRLHLLSLRMLRRFLLPTRQEDPEQSMALGPAQLVAALVA